MPKIAADAVVALVAKFFEIEAAWNAFRSDDQNALDAAADRFSRQQDRLEDKVAELVATSAAGLVAQVRLLREVCLRDRCADRLDRLEAAIKAGVERLAARITT